MNIVSRQSAERNRAKGSEGITVDLYVAPSVISWGERETKGC